MRPTFVMKHFVRNAAAKIKFFMKNTYIIQGKDQFSFNEIQLCNSKFIKFKYLILQVVRNQTIFSFKLFLFMATTFYVILNDNLSNCTFTQQHNKRHRFLHRQRVLEQHGMQHLTLQQKPLVTCKSNSSFALESANIRP